MTDCTVRIHPDDRTPRFVFPGMHLSDGSPEAVVVGSLGGQMNDMGEYRLCVHELLYKAVS